MRWLSRYGFVVASLDTGELEIEGRELGAVFRYRAASPLIDKNRDPHHHLLSILSIIINRSLSLSLSDSCLCIGADLDLLSWHMLRSRLLVVLAPRIAGTPSRRHRHHPVVLVASRFMATTAAAAGAAGAEHSASKSIRFAAIQLGVVVDKAANHAEAQARIEEAVSHGARLISLPECWNSPYSNASFPTYAEPIAAASEPIDEVASPSTALLRSLARRHGVWIVGGSIPERDPADGALYNTCTVWSPDGALLVKYRKMHLFDIDVPGKITFRESDTLKAGGQLATFEPMAGLKIGVGICYDMRFPELARLYALSGCTMLVYPGAFNTTTGPLHWELLQRSRAVDNQLWFSAISPARNPDTTAYQAWGHTSVVSPWGEVVATTEHQPAIVYADIDLAAVETVRANIPVLKQRRTDVYTLHETSSPSQ